MTGTRDIVRIAADCGEEAARRGFSHMAQSMVGSSILKVANEIRELRDQGVAVADMTVGDFAPNEFPIPDALRRYLSEALQAGETNYPPAAGDRELRGAVQEHFLRELGLDYPLEGIAIVSGGRPSLYSTYRLLVDPGELVLFPVPSWNNHNYRDTCGVRVRGVMTRPEDAFQPTADQLRPHVADARLIVLNTPQNPSGGVMREEDVRGFGELLVEENARREREGGKPLYLLYDQIYSLLTFPGYEHWSPVQLVPECAPYVVHADGISKGFCATGLRCGWLVAAPAVARKVVALGTHVGAWAPRPVQTATARFLRDREAMDAWRSDVIERVRERLDLLDEGLRAMRADGLPVDCIEPQGAIYMSVQLRLAGMRTADGRVLADNEDIRSWLLQVAAFGLVPFSAFGVEPEDEDGWFRASVGAVGPEDVRAALPRLRAALESLRPA